jgi:hypothetical protein
MQRGKTASASAPPMSALIRLEDAKTHQARVAGLAGGVLKPAKRVEASAESFEDAGSTPAISTNL